MAATMLGLDQLADVYAENPSTGRFDTLVKSQLRCRLAHVNVNNVIGATERAELAAMRNMLFEAGYVMSETAQVEVDGIRWQPVAGTFGAFRDWNSEVIYRRCDVVRQV